MQVKSWGLVEAWRGVGAPTMLPGPGVSLLQPVHLWFSFIPMFKYSSKRTISFPPANILGMTLTSSKENSCTLPIPILARGMWCSDWPGQSHILILRLGGGTWTSLWIEGGEESWCSEEIRDALQKKGEWTLAVKALWPLTTNMPCVPVSLCLPIPGD